MIKEYKIPSPGESISEVEIATWMVEDGAFVEKNDELAEVESDKATLMLVAEESGIISIKAPVGQTVKVGSVAYTLDTSAVKQEKAEVKVEPRYLSGEVEAEVEVEEKNKIKVTPVAEQLMKENQLNIEDVLNGLRRISKADVQAVINTPTNKPAATEKQNTAFSRASERAPMSMLRRRLSQRLVSVKNETAMLTTFNEVDMSAVMELRQKMQEKFVAKNGFKLGFMGFFAKAVAIAAQEFPTVNSQIEGDSVVSPSFVDIGIAVQTPKGLMVPNVRNAESKTVAQIEFDIKELAQKARDKKISIEELSGGTISITNGGVFGSLLSTPIINPPQSAILGMHNIVDRPIALNGQVVIRPMMYIALSYDHRLIDGKDSVGFLKTVKELIENPVRLLFDGQDPMEKVID
jgi:2-oxoglutarate dehydrogenase E2 component (dihydrolipoamide succinyltransferase)